MFDASFDLDAALYKIFPRENYSAKQEGAS